PSTPPPQNSATFRTNTPKSLICNISATPSFYRFPTKTRANSRAAEHHALQKNRENPKNQAKRPASGAFERVVVEICLYKFSERANSMSKA
ncbi:hypothetical protein QWZ03_00005, partial [Chitinimonas viridis]